MKKRCCACGCTYTLSGSGKRQKYCSECAKRGDGRLWGLSASNPFKIKGVEKHFSAPIPLPEMGSFVREQIEARKDQTNRIRFTFTTPDGSECNVWLAESNIGDDRWWRVNVLQLLERISQERRRRERQITLWNPTAKALNRPIVVVGRNEPVKDMAHDLGILKGFRALTLRKRFKCSDAVGASLSVNSAAATFSYTITVA